MAKWGCAALWAVRGCLLANPIMCGAISPATVADVAEASMLFRNITEAITRRWPSLLGMMQLGWASRKGRLHHSRSRFSHLGQETKS